MFDGDAPCFPCLKCSNSEINAEAHDSAQLTLSSQPISDIKFPESSCGIKSLLDGSNEA
uniref:Uncharacterized protein n=1 Tax=Rhizophora mucronata TaxID=61149 RepID=A0A2P2PI80_RHIMU